MMSIRLEPVTAHNRRQVLELQVTKDQTTYIEQVEECLEEAAACRSWRPVGIYAEDTLVGFAMYGFFPEYRPFGRVWMDRLLIDARYQGRGYGRAAMEQLLIRLEATYHRRRIYLSVFPENEAALQLYQSLGFRATGETDIHGEIVFMRQASHREMRQIRRNLV